jgi:ribosomal protein S18 acetylase RimI-like enzyme
MEYRTDAIGIEALEIDGFFEGWQAHPDRDGLVRILAGSSKRIMAIEDGKLIGFITAITDGVLSAYIPLIEVLPEYRGKGIGGELASRMLKELSPYYMIDLVCDESVAGFYEQFGMKRNIAMSLRTYEQQSGIHV